MPKLEGIQIKIWLKNKNKLKLNIELKTKSIYKWIKIKRQN